MTIFEDWIDFSKLLIVDSNPEAFLVKPQNGVPVIPFNEEEDDLELPRLSNYLSKLSAELNPVKCNASTFKLHKLESAYNEKEGLSFLVPSIK